MSLAGHNPGSAETPWTIGDPGRAATELGDCPPHWAAGHADIAVSAAAVPGIVARGASSRGLMHRRFVEPRQDAFAWASPNTAASRPSFVAAVCDGLGALRRSHEGADAVARQLVTASVDGRSWPDAFVDANAVIAGLDRSATAVPGERVMATTAVAVRIDPVGGGWQADIAWVGDSPCWHLSSEGAWTPITSGKPEDGADDYHSTAVRPLPSTDGACRTRTITIGGGALFLLTDGVADPLGWGTDVQATLADWWATPPEPLAFAGQVGFARKSHMDDRTAVGLWFDSSILESEDGDAGPQG